MEINIVVNKQQLVAKDFPKSYIAGTQEFIKFNFHLEDSWRKHKIYAQFEQGGEAYNVYLDNHFCAYLPPEITKGTCTLALHGVHGDSIAISEPITLIFDDNPIIDGEEATGVTPSLYVQLVEKVGELEEIIEAGGGQVVVDSTMSTTSVHPVQNKVITNAIDSLFSFLDTEDTYQFTEIDDATTTSSVDTWSAYKINSVVSAIEAQIPTKTSELTNDSNFVTSAAVPTKTSQLTNDSNFVTSAQVPTKTSQLTNDSNFISTETDPTVPSWAKSATKPTYSYNEINGRLVISDTTRSVSMLWSSDKTYTEIKKVDDKTYSIEYVGKHKLSLTYSTTVARAIYIKRDPMTSYYYTIATDSSEESGYISPATGGEYMTDEIQLVANSTFTLFNATDYVDAYIKIPVVDQIEELKKSVGDGKSLLAEAITDKGVETASSDSFETMAENIESISSGGCSATFRVSTQNRKYYPDLIDNMQIAYFESDVLLNSDLSFDDFTVSDLITNVEYVDDNVIKVTFSEPLENGDNVTFTANSDAFKYNNGTSNEYVHNVHTKLSELYHENENLIQMKTLVKQDSWTGYVDIPVNYPTIYGTSFKKVSYRVAVNSESVITPDGAAAPIKVFNCDNSVYNAAYQLYHTEDVGDTLKIRWEGMVPYGINTINLRYETYFMGNGDFELVVEDFDATYTDGVTSVAGTTFTLSPQTHYSFYREGRYSSSYIMVQETYDITKHKTEYDVEYVEAALTDVVGTKLGVDTVVSGINHDTAGYYIKDMWFDATMRGVICNTLLYHGDSYFTPYRTDEDGNRTSCGSNITVIGYDGRVDKVYGGAFTLTDYNNMKCMKFVWVGKAYYQTTENDKDWELYIFENGDAMIHVNTLGTIQSGSSAFLGNSFTAAEGATFSFYRKDTEGNTWKVVEGIYDLSQREI